MGDTEGGIVTGSTSHARCATLVTKQVINREWEWNCEWVQQMEVVIQIFDKG